MFSAQTLGVKGLSVAYQYLMQVACAGYLVQLMQLQPQSFRHRAVQLAGADQRATEAVGRALQGHGQQLVACRVRLCGDARDDQFVADGQVVLQGLAQVGDFARAFIQDNRLVEEVFLELLADEIDFRTENLQQLQAIFRGGQQLVEFDQGLVELACRFTNIGLGQAVHPFLQVAGAGFAE